MFISNQKERFQVIHTLEERRKFSSLLQLKKADRDSPWEGVFFFFFFVKKRLKKKKIKHGRPGCSLCHPGFCFSHRVDDHLSALPGEKQWFLLAWASTQKSDISHDTSEGKKKKKKKAHLRGDVVVVNIKSYVATADLVNQDHQTPLFNIAQQKYDELICWFLIKCWQGLFAHLDQCMCGLRYYSLNLNN